MKKSSIQWVNRVSLALLMAGPFFLGGCSTMSDVLSSKADGTAKVYDVTPDQAWDIAEHVFRWDGADAIEEHKDEHYMLTSASHRPFSGANFMGAWIEPLDGLRTKVTIVTKRKVATQIFTTLTEGGFQEDFQKGVAIVKAGKPLPIASP